MGGKNSGRNRVDDPKYVKSVRLKVSTLVKVEELSEDLGVSQSEILQKIVDSSVDSFYNLVKRSKFL